MKIWRVVIKDEKDKKYSRVIRGEAKTYAKAAIEALAMTRGEKAENVLSRYVDEIFCYGEKEF